MGNAVFYGFPRPRLRGEGEGETSRKTFERSAPLNQLASPSPPSSGERVRVRGPHVFEQLTHTVQGQGANDLK